jgi:hypothetical protein
VIVHDHAETPSAITLKSASTIAEMRRDASSRRFDRKSARGRRRPQPAAWCRMARAWLDVLLVLLVLLGAGLAATCRAQSDAEALEYRIKAAFVCKFPSYVEWPENVFARPDSPIVIGVVGSGVVIDELTRTAADLSADGRPLAVRRLRRGESVAGTHILYVAHSEEGRAAETIAAAKGQPVLVVTESNQAPVPGSMINFVVVENKVRFDIAPQAAELNRLRISARLLGVARNVITKAS